MQEKVDPELLKSMKEGMPVKMEGVPPRAEEPENEAIPKRPPKWLKYDKQTLKFDAYFQEPVHESKVENFRIRKCIMYFYLDDDTLHVIEPKVENSGIPQGVFLKRHKVPNESKPGENYSFQDFNLAISLQIYGRVFRIIDCDEFTKKFYADNGVTLNPPEDYPDNLFEKDRILSKTKIAPPDFAESKEYVEKKLNGGRPNKNLQMFLENDRKVLSFDIVWDDRGKDGGLKFYKLDYFLADETVEVREIREQNSGKDPYPKLLKRSKLPKIPVLTHCPGMKMKKDEFYKAADFILGNKVRIYERDCLIFDCDDYTKEWYKVV
jgi:EF-hand domain-containing protein 1